MAAGVQFPLAEEGSLSANFGSRHRAALGMVHESDCLVVVVSEETGTVSIGVDGQLETRLEANEVRDVLLKHLSGPPDGGTPPAPSDAPEQEAPATAAKTEAQA